MHVHQVLDTSPEYKAEHDFEIHSQEASTDMAFLKHIRPMTGLADDGTPQSFPCHFGRQSDPDGRHLIVDD